MIMKKHFLFFLFALFGTNLVEAQELYFKDKPLMFFHEKSQQMILIENDSIIIKTKNKKRIKLKSNGIPAPLTEFLPFYIQKKLI